MLERNKAPGLNGLDPNIITSVYKFTKKPLLKIFNESINLGIFPEKMKLVKKFFNLIFQSGFLPLIQRATRVTRTTATAIDHIITDAILESTMHSGIIKANISDHFPIFAILENGCNKNKNYKKPKITNQNFGNKNIQNFQFC